MVLGLLTHVTSSIFSLESLGVKLQFTNIHIFFRTAVLRKLFNIRFSYKHCNFSPICLLIKMALKPVTRSIPNLNHLRLNSDECQFSSDNIHNKLWELIKWSPEGKCFHLWSNFLDKSNSLINKCRPVWRICMWIRGTCPEGSDNFQTHPPVSLQAFLFVLWALYWCSAVYPSVASVSPFDP